MKRAYSVATAMATATTSIESSPRKRKHITLQQESSPSPKSQLFRSASNSTSLSVPSSASSSSSPQAVAACLPPAWQTKPSAQPNSVSEILRRFPNSRVYVRPIHWTSLQLDLLQCCIVQIPTKTPAETQTELHLSSSPSTPTIPGLHKGLPSPNHHSSSQIRVHVTAAQRYAALSLLQSRNNIIEKTLTLSDVLHDWGFSCRSIIYSNTLPFYFDRQRVDSLPVGRLYRRGRNRGPALAYLDSTTLNELRLDSLSLLLCPRRPHRRRCSSTQVWSLNQKRLRRLQPPSPSQDPYLVAVLIALAQAHARAAQAQTQDQAPQSHGQRLATVVLPDGKDKDNDNDREDALRLDAGGQADSHAPRQPPSTEAAMPPSTSSPPVSFKVQLIVTSIDGNDDMYLYTANVPAQFLAKLDTPSVFSPAPPLRIEARSIPLRPPEMLLEVLGRELQADLGD